MATERSPSGFQSCEEVSLNTKACQLEKMLTGLFNYQHHYQNYLISFFVCFWSHSAELREYSQLGSPEMLREQSNLCLQHAKPWFWCSISSAISDSKFFKKKFFQLGPEIALGTKLDLQHPMVQEAFSAQPAQVVLQGVTPKPRTNGI